MILRNARVGDALLDIPIENGVITSAAGGEELDLDGRWVSPGLWDNHVHFSQWSLVSQRLDLSGATSAAHAARLVADGLLARGLLAGGLLAGGHPVPFVGYGFRDGLWPDAPNLADLDAVSASVPIVLVSADVHSVWLNSAALELYGHAGHPSGLIREDEAFEI